MPEKSEGSTNISLWSWKRSLLLSMDLSGLDPSSLTVGDADMSDNISVSKRFKKFLTGFV
jgi:hypothetical protein